MVVESHHGLEVVGEAASPQDAVALASAQQPDVIVLDVEPDAENDIELIPKLRAVARTRVLVLTGVTRTEFQLRAVRLGAMGIVDKTKSRENFLTAIEKANAGEAWLDRITIADVISSAAGRSSENEPSSLIAALSPRERDVVVAVSQGMTNDEIGRALFISEATVRHHLTSIFAKLAIPTRAMLIVFAHRHRLTGNEPFPPIR